MRNVIMLSEQHLAQVRSHFADQNGREGAGYFFCGLSEAGGDPWNGQPTTKFLVREFEPVGFEDVVSSSETHITWNTDSFVRALRRLREEDEVIALIHNHPGALENFSEQDNSNEAELITLATKRNGPTKILSVIILRDGRIFGRVWMGRDRLEPLDLIIVSGKRFTLHYIDRGRGKPVAFLNRQALALGKILNDDLAQLRVGIVGCGATGSAVAMLLPRLGFRYLALFDQDKVDETNLNRLHFASTSDFRKGHLKVDVIKRGIEDMELGVRVKVFPGWVNDLANREALKCCDVIFGCTDDNSGRLFLNRFAYFYRTLVIDMGLAIKVGTGDPPLVQAFDGRVTVLQPGTVCLLCRGIIDVARAHAESLKRTDPMEYERQKDEAYVLGENDPSPAVVPFTTAIAATAVEELINRLQGFRGPGGSVDHRIRQFHRLADRRLGHQPAEDCPLCGSAEYWGRGDMDPFLDASP